MLETRRLDRVTFNACEVSRSTKEVWKCCAIDPFSTGFFAKRNHKCTCTTVAEYTNFHVYIKLMLEVAIFLWTSVSEGTCWSFTNCEMLLTMYRTTGQGLRTTEMWWHRHGTVECPKRRGCARTRNENVQAASVIGWIVNMRHTACSKSSAMNDSQLALMFWARSQLMKFGWTAGNRRS